jgi:glycerol-3-phosphate dehydrogenase
MAEDTLSKIIKRKMLPNKKCITEDLKIHGYTHEKPNGAFSYYGADKIKLDALISSNKLWAEPLDKETNIVAGQVVWAIRNEMAGTVEDFLARRVRVLFTDAKLAMKLAPEVAEIMMKELCQDEVWKEKQVDAFTQLAKGYLLKVI